MKLGVVALGLCGSVLAACTSTVTDDPVGQGSEDIVRGHEEDHIPQVVAVRIEGWGGASLCSGTYVSSRMVVTAAHCARPDAIPGQTFVYFGNDYNTDKASLPAIPPPGQPSKWARGESMVVHPDYSANLNYPDVAVVLLDRELPFAPIPVDRHHVPDWVHYGKIVGWGGSRALTPDISQVEGAGVKRSAIARIVGSPTAADYHDDDPNPGMLDPNIRANLLKIDGRAPRANGCAGDSGSPLLVQHHGRWAVGGINFWEGLSCEDYSIYTRIDPALDFLDAQAERTGKADIVPRLECVEENTDGGLTAHFGYRNDNGVTVSVPYGVRNFFPKDSDHARPSAFAPGDNPYAFSVDFGASDSLRWRLTPGHGRGTVVRADASSPRCDPNDETLVCADACNAELAAECSVGASRSQCISDCVSTAGYFEYSGCVDAWNGYLSCAANLAPAAENWDCSFPGIAPSPLSPNCDDQLIGLYTCLGYY